MEDPVWVFPKIGVPPNHGFSLINHPFWGTPIFGNTRISTGKTQIVHVNVGVMVTNNRFNRTYTFTTRHRCFQHFLKIWEQWGTMENLLFNKSLSLQNICFDFGSVLLSKSHPAQNITKCCIAPTLHLSNESTAVFTFCQSNAKGAEVVP